METGTLRVVLWILVAAASLLSTGIGVVLSYHWFKFSTSRAIPFLATMVYAGVTLALLICLTALALSV